MSESRVAEKLSQTEKVYRHMRDYGGITTWEAFTEYGITRLSAKIYDLRHDGKVINDRWITKTNRYGEPVKYKEYWIGDSMVIMDGGEK